MAIINGTPGNDVLNGTVLADVISGLAGDDILNGLAGNDVLNGGDGNDRLNGGAGTDTLNGGLGNDIYFFLNGIDAISDSGGIDTIVSSVAINLAAPAFAAIENLSLAGAANINGFGNGLDNVIVGNVGSNVLAGGAGNDRLAGNAGNDALSGGDGNDFLNGGTGADIMNGGAGNDVYIVDDVADVVVEIAGGGIDTIQSLLSRSLAATPQVENLVLVGAAVNGSGNGLNNVLVGNAANNLLDGAGGNDALAGAAGNDDLRGNVGNDALNGGAGSDILRGGAGADRFVFVSVADSAVGALRDVITDFVAALGDRVDLSRIDANPLLAGDQSFVTTDGAVVGLVSDNPFTAAGQIRFDTLPGTAIGILEGNIDADLAADFQIQLNGVANLDLSGLVL